MTKENYSDLRGQAYILAQQCGVVSVSGRRLGRERIGAHALDEVANENLPLLINDLKQLKLRLRGYNN